MLHGTHMTDEITVGLSQGLLPPISSSRSGLDQSKRVRADVVMGLCSDLTSVCPRSPEAITMLDLCLEVMGSRRHSRGMAWGEGLAHAGDPCKGFAGWHHAPTIIENFHVFHRGVLLAFRPSVLFYTCMSAIPHQGVHKFDRVGPRQSLQFILHEFPRG